VTRFSNLSIERANTAAAKKRAKQISAAQAKHNKWLVSLLRRNLEGVSEAALREKLTGMIERLEQRRTA
jgi:hypothetical protein